MKKLDTWHLKMTKKEMRLLSRKWSYSVRVGGLSLLAFCMSLMRRKINSPVAQDVNNLRYLEAIRCYPGFHWDRS